MDESQQPKCIQVKDSIKVRILTELSNPVRNKIYMIILLAEHILWPGLAFLRRRDETGAIP